jgi:hypothetical protein
VYQCLPFIMTQRSASSGVSKGTAKVFNAESSAKMGTCSPHHQAQVHEKFCAQFSMPVLVILNTCISPAKSRGIQATRFALSSLRFTQYHGKRSPIASMTTHRISQDKEPLIEQIESTDLQQTITSSELFLLGCIRISLSVEESMVLTLAS